MGTTKTENYTAKQNKIAILSKAIGHPARIAIIDLLLKKKSCICGDIVNELPLAQATISQHLKELKNTGLIKGNIEGNSICYCLDLKVWNELLSYFTKVSKKIEKQSPSCCN